MTSTYRQCSLAATAILGVTLTSQLVGQQPAAASTVPSVQITSALTAFNSTPVKTVAAKCPTGQRVIGGGGRVNGAQHVVITQQRPVYGSASDKFVVSASEDQFGTSQFWAVKASRPAPVR